MIELILIANDSEIAAYAQDSGVDRIMVDLEIIGKNKRQGHLDTLISNHSIRDVYKLRQVIDKSSLMVRVNPIYNGSKEEIDKVVDAGADIVMLPMFTTTKEVETFIKLIDKRAKTILLFETPQALVRIDSILEKGGIDEVYIGLNDLHLGMGLDFMFELLSGGIVEYMAEKVNFYGKKFGFGGISRLGKGKLDSSLILSEHVRLSSQLVILSRDFHGNVKDYHEFTQCIDLPKEVKQIKNYYNDIKSLTLEELEHNRSKLIETVNNIVN